jgi:hypothetical protein
LCRASTTGSPSRAMPAEGGAITACFAISKETAGVDSISHAGPYALRLWCVAASPPDAAAPCASSSSSTYAPAVLPPTYALHIALHAPPQTLVARYPSTLTPSSAYLCAQGTGTRARVRRSGPCTSWTRLWMWRWMRGAREGRGGGSAAVVGRTQRSGHISVRVRVRGTRARQVGVGMDARRGAGICARTTVRTTRRRQRISTSSRRGR